MPVQIKKKELDVFNVFKLHVGIWCSAWNLTYLKLELTGLLKKDNFKQHFVGKNRLRKISASSCCKN